jgi:hypothetical protein
MEWHNPKVEWSYMVCIGQKTTENIHYMWGSSEEDIFAVGTNGLMLHWDGKAWSKIDSGTNALISTIHGRNRNDIWAAVGGVRRHLLHWDGIRWERVVLNTDSIILSFFSSPPGASIWAIGSGGLLLRHK